MCGDAEQERKEACRCAGKGARIQLRICKSYRGSGANKSLLEMRLNDTDGVMLTDRWKVHEKESAIRFTVCIVHFCFKCFRRCAVLMGTAT